jgi:predicted outer membrane protein
MSAAIRLRVGVASAGLCFLLLGYCVAQQVQTSDQTRSDRSRAGATGQSDRSPGLQSERTYRESAERRTANFRGPNAGGSQAVDRFYANCLLAQNESEVQLSQIAQQKSENDQVKQFAQQMIQDHQKMIQQLQPLAEMQRSATRGVSGSLGTSNRTSTTTGRSTATTDATNPSNASSSEIARSSAPSGTTAAAPGIEANTDATTGTAITGRMAGDSAVHQLAAIDRQINERCTQAAKEELQQKSGAEFDKCYVGNAISAHMHALAALEVLGQQTQGQLAQVAKQAQPTVQQHLDHAKQLMKQLEGQGSAGSTAERSSSTRTE